MTSQPARLLKHPPTKNKSFTRESFLYGNWIYYPPVFEYQAVVYSNVVVKGEGVVSSRNFFTIPLYLPILYIKTMKTIQTTMNILTIQKYLLYRYS